MWKLKQVYAQNLCAFKELKYELLQQHTTLIFGNNMDNDSQGSNGSGKSAMLEAIAIGLTGETLRKIKMDEIINDAENEAVVSLVLYNDASGQHLSIQRTISRKSAQNIKICTYTDDVSKSEQIEQANIGDYNKFILEILGLTKDDIFANFILSKHKYTSFLSSSDRDKKEIINRFSNGIMVDESIAALQEDMMPVQEALQQAESNVANCTGRVEALQEQINTAITESTERSQKKAERIKNWHDAIATKRAYIREQNELIKSTDSLLDKYDELDKSLQELEESKKDVKGCFSYITEQFDAFKLCQPKDYVTIASDNQNKLKQIEKEYTALQKEESQLKKKLDAAHTNQDKLTERYNKFQNEFGKKAEKINKQIDDLIAAIKKLDTDNEGLRKQRLSLQTDIANLQKQLAGIIVCPKCKHEFTLAGDVNIEETRLKIQDRTGETNDISQTIENNQKLIEDYTAKGREMRVSQNELNASKAEWSEKLTQIHTEVNNLTCAMSDTNHRMQTLTIESNALQKAIDDSRKNLFDEVFDILDEAIKSEENKAKQAELNIQNAEGAIQSYEESIRDIEKSSETDVIESLKISKKKYEKELNIAISEKESVEQKLNQYKVQEATFVEFKTHLANTKIDALSHITNEFLEAIGSDIRIAFSGFTVLKSGKIRDKISISLIRDGIDCGSFDKFSEGEKARVALANILAMHKLTNLNCEDDKGLDLLILDEILDATDEQGLSNIFNALNQLQITSLVVSHGNIAENYPYKVVVNKLNGISYIDA